MKTLVLGASVNPSRYAFLATQLLRSFNHEVIAVGKTEGKIGDVTILHDFPKGEKIDTITLYLNPTHQEDYYERILAAHPRRIIFNPGTENETLRKMAEEKGIETDYACTLVLLNTGQY